MKKIDLALRLAKKFSRRSRRYKKIIVEQEKEIEALKTRVREVDQWYSGEWKARAERAEADRDTWADRARQYETDRDDLTERLCGAVTVARGSTLGASVWFAHFLGLTGVEFSTGSDADHEVAAVRNAIRKFARK